MYCSDDELLIQGFNLAVRIRIGCEPALNWRDLEEALSEHDSGCLTGWIWVGSYSGSQIPRGGLHFFELSRVSDRVPPLIRVLFTE